MTAIEKLKASPVEHKGERVITLGMMDEAHERPDGTAGRAFRKHREKLEEGRHYFVDANRRETSIRPEQGGGKDPVLLTERGYLVLVKTFRDDLAWKVQEDLVEGYFRARAADLEDPRIAQALTVASQGVEMARDAHRAVNALTHMVSDLLKVDRRRQAEAGRIMAGFRPRRGRKAASKAQANLPLNGSGAPKPEERH